MTEAMADVTRAPRTSQAGGIVAVCAAMALFAANDAILKILSERIGAAQIMMLRGLLGGALLSVLIVASGAGTRLRTAFRPAVLLRTLCDALASIMFVMALMGLPVATITALIQLVPITTALAGVFLFGEALTRRQLAALALGFAGVLGVTRPFAGNLDVHLFFGLAAIILLSLRDVVTRGAAAGTSSLVIATLTTFAVPLLSVPQFVEQGWRSVDIEAAILVSVISAFVAVGNLLMVVAVSCAPLSTITPFRYSAIPFAIVAGTMFLHEYPDLQTVVAAGAIALSGILALPRFNGPPQL